MVVYEIDVVVDDGGVIALDSKGDVASDVTRVFDSISSFAAKRKKNMKSFEPILPLNNP